MKNESSRSKAGMGGGKKSSSKGKHPHEIHIRHGKSGGHIVRHKFAPADDGTTPEDEEHVLPDKAALLAHIDQNVPDQSAQAAPAGPPAAAAVPQSAPATPTAAPGM